MARPPQDPQIRITEILDTAEYLFTVKGYFGTTVSDIAKEMGVTQGMFYYYFKSKEEILEALLNRHVACFLAEIKNMTHSDASPAEKLGFMISTVIKDVRAHGEELLNTIHHEQNLHIKNKLTKGVTLMLTPLGLNIIEEGRSRQVFNVPHPQTAMSFILLIIDFLIAGLYEKQPRELLSLRLRMAESLVEKTVGIQEGNIHISL
ncbi:MULTISPECIES: TetR/AcrR family transcriptional regulator [Sporomusa]|uniref:TetR/AcrR family transcriptional regulator n=1 Tax=Sporomusa TaxID=2375 RepID=UPI00202FA5D6|nr:TetR/AcrR family transcriptional regulator [Sporomusa sphaeroides]MCM0757535.1 TetR/AcrR family transcriptional regulator [Sporomusa sphaeroides DSM 2875]